MSYIKIDEIVFKIGADTCQVVVYVLDNKKSIMQYCRETGLPFREGFKRLYQNEQKSNTRLIPCPKGALVKSNS